MTKAVETLVAGRDLDALIAERVMGWEVDRKHKYGLYSRSTFVRDDKTKVGFPPGTPEFCDCRGSSLTPKADRHRHYTSVPHYSTDIAAAWKIFDRFLIVCLLKDAQTTPSEPFLGQVFDGKQTHYARAENPALALCRAALSAIEAAMHD